MNKFERLPRGVLCAAVTPMKDGGIDLPAFRALIHRQVENHAAGIVVCGTTGEAPTLTAEEKSSLLAAALEESDGKTMIVMGSGSSDTRTAIEATRRAKEEGADGVLVVSPYYNKGTEAGIYEHYLRIADSADLPIILYNVPTRTGVDLSLEMYERLASHENICGVKEASPNIEKLALLCKLSEGRLRVYTGNDSHFLPALSLGGDGVISVVANILPGDMCRIFESFSAGELKHAVVGHMKLIRLMKLMFAETSPAPVKCACELLGLCRGEMRLPMAPVTDETAKHIRSELCRLGLL